jgi:uncharacterized protein (DUF1800 family)
MVVLATLLAAAGCGSSSQSSAPGGGTDAGADGFVVGDAGGLTGAPTGPIGVTGAARLLAQGTFGPHPSEITAVSTQTYAQWFGAQAATPPSLLLPLDMAGGDFNTDWWTLAVTGKDELRQRIAYALSQIFVVSLQTGPLWANDQAVSHYRDLITQHAFGNFRDLLDVISHSCEMGQYLTYFQNDKPNAATGVHADENYAREIMQLFTIGLVELNQDGSQKVDKNGNPIPTYAQKDVENLARVFTGWASTPLGGGTVNDENSWMYDLDYLHPMACYPKHHDTDAKTIVGGVTVPAGGTCDSDMKIALDTLFNHPNVAPFIGKQLIQRLVTSNPSPTYVSRVAAVFANNGAGVRGDMLAVVEAVLTDPEAIAGKTTAKLREPVVRIANLWRAFSATDSGDPNVGASSLITTQGYWQIAQAPFYSPTVFNFYRPDYVFPGPLAMAKLVAPEFQISNEYTVVSFNNLIEYNVYEFIDSAGEVQSGFQGYPDQSVDTLLHTAEWEPYATDAGKLVDELNLVFMAGQMPAAMRTSIIDYVNQTMPQATATSAAAKAGWLAIEATIGVVTSPQYAIQR